MAVKKTSRPTKKVTRAKPSESRTAKKTSNTVKREPTPGAVLKKMAVVSDSTKQLSKEIKTMGKIFADNQKILISMKTMMDAITTSLEQIQKQSKQINILEDDNQKLFAGLNQARLQADIVSKLNFQTAKLEDEMGKIRKTTPKTEELAKQVGDSMNSIQNNSQMIIKIAQRIDDVRDQLRQVSGKTESLAEISVEIESLKKGIESGANIAHIREELDNIAQKANATEFLKGEMVEISKTIRTIAEKAENIDSLEGIINGLKQQFANVAEKAAPISSISSELESIKSKVESISHSAGKIDAMEGEMESLAKKADEAVLVGEGIRSVQMDVGEIRQNLADKTDTIEQKIATLVGTVRKSDESPSRDVIALLKLSEFQSRIRMNSESKYGELKDIEGMASQIGEIAKLFQDVSADGGVEMPSDVQQWAVSKIFDCADKWEIRFSDVFNVLHNKLGKEGLKDMIRIQQVRDIYGIRAVDEIRGELGIS